MFPVGTVEETDTWEKYPRAIKDDMSRDDAVFRKAYTGPEKYNHAPVSLQLVTRRYNEEQALLIVEEVVRCIADAKGDITAT